MSKHRTIRDAEDLASHLGAREASSEAIAHRIYKDTNCGCAASYEERGVVGRTSRTYLRTYTVECRVSIVGLMVLAWRPSHKKTRLVPRHPDHAGKVREITNERGEVVARNAYEPLPDSLAEYLLCADEAWPRRIGQDVCDSAAEVAREYGSKFIKTLKADAKTGEEGVVRITSRGPLVWLLTVRVRETRTRVNYAPKFTVTGYCEGTDIPCEPHEVFLPCTPKEVDDAIRWADQDGCDLWDQTHGCDKCWPDGSVDEWGNVYTPDSWVGQPVNPECPACEGAGAIL